MPDHELHAVTDKLVGDRDAFLRVGAIIAELAREFLSEDAPGRVDVSDRLLGAVLELRPEGGAAAGERSADPELDLG
jgi:hypothetical protein